MIKVGQPRRDAIQHSVVLGGDSVAITVYAAVLGKLSRPLRNEAVENGGIL